MGDLNDINFFNNWIVNAADRAIKHGTCYHSHCIPQHTFVYDDESNGMKQVVTHVLKMENLSEEFPALMKEYELPVILEHANKTPSACLISRSMHTSVFANQATLDPPAIS